MLPVGIRAVSTDHGRLTGLETPDCPNIDYDRKLFSNKKSAVLLYTGGPHSLVVKQVKQADRIREEHAAIKLLNQMPSIVGFVPTAALQTSSGKCFSFNGSSYFVMPHIGCDLVAYRQKTMDKGLGEWASIVIRVLSVAAAAMLSLWNEAGATYYDIKARNILAVSDLCKRHGRLNYRDVLLCDTGSINSRAATHHVPAGLCQHTTQGSADRYRLYAAWGLACTLLELLDGPEVPRALRRMRKQTNHAAPNAMFEALERVCASVFKWPEVHDRVVQMAALLINGQDQRGPGVTQLLEAVANI
jgi:hypothetical protein